jgi:hypothetical protein
LVADFDALLRLEFASELDRLSGLDLAAGCSEAPDFSDVPDVSDVPDFSDAPALADSEFSVELFPSPPSPEALSDDGVPFRLSLR